MPYHSSDILEKAKEEPKKALDPHEDDKLSGDMRELYDRLKPTQANTDVRNKFVAKVQRILETEFPGNEFKVSIFGSSGNMLWTAESDVDLCIQTPMKKLEEMHMLAEALDKHGMERVVCIPAAKVRIVKVWDPELQLACDMNVNNAAALENTRMIKTYIDIDDRVRPLAMIIKYWTKRRILNDAGIGGTISSYTWICMILNFLQTRDPPILPSLHKLPDRQTDSATGKPSLSSFADDLDKLRGFGAKNEESLGQLLFHFFRLYGHEVDYEKIVVSVRQGNRIPREEKNWHPGGGQKEGVNRLCVEEPFSTDRNLGNSADDYAWRGLHLEIRRAFDLLADKQQLDKACEQYEFPAHEQTSSIFKKPQSQKATITSSVPNRSGRGGSSHRGGRGGFNSRNQNGNNRRASGSNSYLQGRPPFLHSPPISAGPGQEYFAFPRGLHDQLHDQLAQQYQMLEMQSASLRAQLAAQQHAQQAHQVRAAQMHAHAVAQAQAQNRGQNSVSGSPQKSPYVNGRSSPRLAEIGIPPNALPQNFFYPYPGIYQQPSDPAAQDAPRTNPSSPSMASSMPGLRRQVHRASNASDTGSLRSHSQPPRGGVPQSLPVGYPVFPQFFDPSMVGGYPIARSSIPQEVVNLQPTLDSQESPRPSHIEVAVPETPIVMTDPNQPKDNIVYHLAEEQPQPPPLKLQDYTVGPIPSFSELAQRKRRVSPEITQPLLNTALRRVSRSPSPLGGHMRSYSTNLPVHEQHKARVDSARPPVDHGPMIVNGSFPAPQREPRSRSGTNDAIPVDVANVSGLSIYATANNQAMHQIHQISELQARQQQVYEEMQRQKAAAAVEMMPPIVNGSTANSPPTDNDNLVRVPSDGQQPFPTLSEGWINFDPTNGSHDAEQISPKHSLSSQWRNPPFTNGLPSLDTATPPQPHPPEIQSATLPLLSPVIETRTPSPTASRSNDLNKAVNGVKAQAKNDSQQARRSSHTAQTSTPKDIRNGQQKGKAQVQDNVGKSAGPQSSAPWQQQTSSRNKNKNKNKSKKAAEQKAAGEPLPTNIAERKGG